MAKEAYYFSHDANARQDPKILAMTSVYGMEGYGRYWVIVEMLREQSDHTLDLQGKYTFNALAMQLQCNKDTAEEFVHDCINEFGLLESDGEKFWSNSLLRRMAIKEEISNKRKKAAEARWNKEKQSTSNTDVMQMHSKSNAIKGKESKGNKKKENKKQYAEYVTMLPSEYDKLVNKFGQVDADERIERLNLYKGSKGVKYKNDYMTVLSWARKEEKERPKKKEPQYESNSIDSGDLFG